MIDWNDNFDENLRSVQEDLNDSWETASGGPVGEEYSNEELSKKLDILFDTLTNLLYALHLKAEGGK